MTTVIAVPLLAARVRESWRRWTRVPFGLRLVNFLFQHLLRINAGAPCSIHFTSRAIRPERISVGRGAERSFAVSGGCYFQAGNGIHIGEGTIFGPGVKLVSANHDLSRAGAWEAAPPLIVGRACWLGAGVIVLPGVHIGDGSIVGAGAVVTKSVPAGSVVAGNPARDLARPSSQPQASTPATTEDHRI
jgi:acetyltransferase-like isoleucine patch superfamily enzyme